MLNPTEGQPYFVNSMVVGRRTYRSTNDLGNRSFVPMLVIFALAEPVFFVPGASVIIGPFILPQNQLVLGRPSGCHVGLW
jgi:hypothetical protein